MGTSYTGFSLLGHDDDDSVPSACTSHMLDLSGEERRVTEETETIEPSTTTTYAPTTTIDVPPTDETCTDEPINPSGNVCQTCSPHKMFSNKYLLERHLKIHTGVGWLV